MAVIGPSWVFVHVPRTAGQSIAAALADGTKRINGHLPWWQLRKRFPQYSFAVVRNPFTWLPSIYARMIAPVERALPSDERPATFKEWLFEKRFAFWLPTHYGARRPLQRLSQSWFIKGVDFVCRYENLARDLRIVERHIGRAIKPPHLDSWSWLVPPNHHDVETISFIREWHGDVLEQFGYDVPSI